jgi:hypothetical protein
MTNIKKIKELIYFRKHILFGNSFASQIIAIIALMIPFLPFAFVVLNPISRELSIKVFGDEVLFYIVFFGAGLFFWVNTYFTLDGFHRFITMFFKLRSKF